MAKKRKDESLNFTEINDLVSLLNKIMKIMFVLIAIVGIYLIIKLCQELRVMNIFLDLLSIISPAFIGLFVAWLFDPIVKKLNKKGIRRSAGTLIVYICFILLLVIFFATLIPILTEQINEFVKTLPDLFNSVTGFIEDIFYNLDSLGFNLGNFENSLVSNIEEWGNNLASSLPNLTINFVKAVFSGTISIIVGLIIGFFFLIGFDNIGEVIITFLPKKARADAIGLSGEVNTSFRRYIVGALLDSTFVFIITSIAFSIVGLKGAVLFGLFCGLTNIIPYAGPYIGGVPAVIVGFSQGIITGICTFIAVAIIQFLEGNFLQPVIMSKTTKLHPVTIIVGLLIFGHFFGIIGMALSTPLIGACKAIFVYFNEKYELINL